MPFVLIVDDNVEVCDVVARLMRCLKVEARCAHSGPEALAALREVRPDLVLLDISMPGMDGLETLQRMRDVPGCDHTPVVMFTALNDDASRRRAAELGASGYLLKGATHLSDFREALQRHVHPA